MVKIYLALLVGKEIEIAEDEYDEERDRLIGKLEEMGFDVNVEAEETAEED